MFAHTPTTSGGDFAVILHTLTSASHGCSERCNPAVLVLVYITWRLRLTYCECSQFAGSVAVFGRIYQTPNAYIPLKWTQFWLLISPRKQYNVTLMGKHMLWIHSKTSAVYYRFQGNIPPKKLFLKAVVRITTLAVYRTNIRIERRMLWPPFKINTLWIFHII